MFKIKSKIVELLLLVGFLVSGSSAYAVPVYYDYGTLLAADWSAPNSFASNPFAELRVTNNGGGVYDFLLYIHNAHNTSNTSFSDSFGTSAFIGSMSFDFINPDLGPKTILTTAFVGSNAVRDVQGFNGTGSSGGFDVDFGTKLWAKGNNDRLNQNEWVEWTVSGFGASTFGNAYVHVQGITKGCTVGTSSVDCSAKYTPVVYRPPVVTPVPEPQTYAMLLAGLCLVGFSARRKMNNNA